MLSALMVSIVLAGPVGAWEKASSIPVPAVIDAVAADKTSPMVPSAV
jgi:hypothetical protein